MIYIGNSKWTSSGRNHAWHICNNERNPICGKQYSNGALDVFEGDIAQITCQACICKHNNQKELDEDEGSGSYCCGKRMVGKGIMYVCLECGAEENSSS